MQAEYFYDDSPVTPEERRALLIQAGLSAGWDNPKMDVYNDLDQRRDIVLSPIRAACFSIYSVPLQRINWRGLMKSK